MPLLNRTPSRRILLALILGLCPPVAAQTPSGDDTTVNDDFSGLAEEEDAAEQEPTPFVDRAHLFLSNTLVKFVNDVDLFFGDERLDVEAEGSFLRINYGIVANIDGSFDNVSKLRLKADLPRVQEKLNLLLETDEEDEFDGAQQTTPTNNLLAGTNNYSTALRFIARETSKWNVLVDAGLRFGNPPDKFIRNRYRRRVTHRYWNMRLSETFFWYDSKGIGATTELVFDRRIGWHDLFRSSTRATWTRNEDQFDFSHGFALYHEINKDRALGLSFDISGASRPKNHVSGYSYGVTFRARTARDWVFVQLRPAFSHREDDNFRMTPTLTLLLEAIIGKI